VLDQQLYVGLDLSDRPYFQQAQESGRFVLSDFLLTRPAQTPTVMAVYPVSALSGTSDAVVLANVNLDWISKDHEQSGQLLRHFGGADRQHRHSAGGARRPA
jgi:C4-dicarboxylate-specific signal transduction histidine kinase